VIIFNPFTIKAVGYYKVI